MLLGELDEIAGRTHHAHAAGECQVAVAGPDSLNRGVKGRQRRRTRGIDCQRRPGQVKGVGDAPGDDTQRRPGDQMATVVGEFGQSGTVFERRGTDITAHIVTGQVIGIDPAVLQGAPCYSQPHPLLRVHRRRLAR